MSNQTLAGVIARLVVCDTEMNDAYIKTPFRYEPLTIGADQLPAAWHMIEETADQASTSSTAYDVYRIVKFIAIMPESNQDTASAGYSSQEESQVTIRDGVDAYYNDHRKLHTASPANSNLAGLWKEIDYRFQFGTITAWDGTAYVGLRMTLTLYVSKMITPHF